MLANIRAYNIQRRGEDKKKNPVPERMPFVDLSRNENDLRFLNQDEKKKKSGSDTSPPASTTCRSKSFAAESATAAVPA